MAGVEGRQRSRRVDPADRCARGHRSGRSTRHRSTPARSRRTDRVPRSCRDPPRARRRTRRSSPTGPDLHEHRHEMDVDRQGVHRRATGHERNRHDAAQLAGVELVEEELEEAGVGRLVRRRGDDERRRREHARLERSRVGIAPAQQRAAVLGEVDQVRLETGAQKASSSRATSLAASAVRDASFGLPTIATTAPGATAARYCRPVADSFPSSSTTTALRRRCSRLLSESRQQRTEGAWSGSDGMQRGGAPRRAVLSAHGGAHDGEQHHDEQRQHVRELEDAAHRLVPLVHET